MVQAAWDSALAPALGTLAVDAVALKYFPGQGVVENIVLINSSNGFVPF